MRISRLSFVLVAGLVGIACGGETPEPKAPTPPPVETPKPAPIAEAPKPEAKPEAPKKSLAELQAEAGKAMAEGMAAGDAKKVSALYADDAVFKMVGFPETRGKAAIEKSMGEFFGAFTKMKMATSRVFTKDEVVVAEWAMNAVHTGDFMGVKATEKPVGWVGLSIMKFNADGKIAEERIYYDAPTMMSQIGAIKGMKARPVPALPPGPPEMLTWKQDNKAAAKKDVLEKMDAAFVAKKQADWLKSFSDKLEWEDSGMGPSKGKESAKKYFNLFTGAFGDMKPAHQDRWVFGDYVVVESEWNATHKGAFMGIPATKKSVTMHDVTVYKFDGDKIAKGWSYMNGAEIMGQIAPEKMGGPKADAKPAADAKKPAADAKKPAADAKKPAPKK